MILRALDDPVTSETRSDYDIDTLTEQDRKSSPQFTSPLGHEKRN